MQAVTLKAAKRNLSRIVEQVLDDAEPRIVVDEQGRQVVILPPGAPGCVKLNMGVAQLGSTKLGRLRRIEASE